VRALAAILLFSSVAAAQPMMVDPSQMSGIPRPDAQTPANTIVVRLIRGELSNRMSNHEVELVDSKGVIQKSKTNEEGRATFSGLGGGPFRARAKDGDQELSSQPIELPPAVGVRVMLVFKKTGLAAPDGEGRPDKSIPAGTVVVRAVGPDGVSIPGLDVVLGHARAGEDGVVEKKGKTDEAGEAKFTGLDAKPTSGYLAEVIKDGARYSGKPFRLVENMGALVVLGVRPVSKDLGALSIGQGSHLIVDVNDDAVQVMEVLRLHNASGAAVDVPGGLRLPLPDKAVSASAGQNPPPGFSVSGHEAVWRGPIPPGDTDLQLGFVLAYDKNSLEIVQKTPLGFAETAIVTEKIDGFSIEGDGLQREERELQGRMLVLLRGPGTAAGGELRLRLVGLPRSDPTWRYLAAALSIGCLIAFAWYASRGQGGVTAERVKLESRREKLLDELAALERNGANPKRRDELKSKLADVYKALDEVS
jgi:hypothetical protein